MKVWYNRGLSNTYDALREIRKADAARSITLLASHSDACAAVSGAADVFFLEPAGLSEEAYVQWCLETCRNHAVDVFVPQRRRQVLARHRAAFDAAGARLLVMADATVMDMVERKEALYADLKDTDVPIPPHRVFRTLMEYDQAVNDLAREAPVLCVKPCVGIYGAGFRILQDTGCEFDRIVSGDTIRIGRDEFRRALAASSQDKDMMVMAYLPDIEHSIDVLAHKGRLVCAVARRKVGGHQVLEVAGRPVDIATTLTERYALDGVFNLQTREWRGIPYLLEINSRMSGGLIYSCCSGVAFPYWAVLLAAGMVAPDDVPLPRNALRVAGVQGVACLPAQCAATA